MRAPLDWIIVDRLGASGPPCLPGNNRQATSRLDRYNELPAWNYAAVYRIVLGSRWSRHFFRLCERRSRWLRFLCLKPWLLVVDLCIDWLNTQRWRTKLLGTYVPSFVETANTLVWRPSSHEGTARQPLTNHFSCTYVIDVSPRPSNETVVLWLDRSLCFCPYMLQVQETKITLMFTAVWKIKGLHFVLLHSSQCQVMNLLVQSGVDLFHCFQLHFFCVDVFWKLWDQSF